MSVLGPFELLIILGFIPLIVLPICAIVDAATRPDSQWAAADQNKTLWVVLLVAGTFLPILGLVLLIVYFASIRPKLKQAGAGQA